MSNCEKKKKIYVKAVKKISIIMGYLPVKNLGVILFKLIIYI